MCICFLIYIRCMYYTYIFIIYTKIQTHRKEENYHLLHIHSVVMLCSNLTYTIHRTVILCSHSSQKAEEAGPEHLASTASLLPLPAVALSAGSSNSPKSQSEIRVPGGIKTMQLNRVILWTEIFRPTEGLRLDQGYTGALHAISRGQQRATAL